MRRRETFDPFKAIKKTAQTAGKGITKTATAAGAGIKKTAETAGKGITGLPGTIKDKVLAPVWNFVMKIWNSFKFYVSCACCMCIMSSCFTMGIPQMLLGAMSSRRVES